MRADMYDLAVVGAGPAGCAAAITAARQGRRVLLVERGDFPRQKVCGEFVSAESLTLLSELLNAANRPLLEDAVRIHCAQLFVDGRRVSTDIVPPAASIARFDLDAALWHSAKEAGVDARAKTTVSKLEGDGPFELRSSNETFEARSVINATGRWSNLNRKVGNGKHAGDGEKWIGIKAHYEEQGPQSSVDLYFFQGGYCGVQPVNLSGDAGAERVNVSAMVKASIATTLPEVFACNGILRKRSASWRQLGDAVTTSPLIFRRPECVVGRTLCAGDAAGFVDPFVGDGISLALRSGVLAAGCLSAFFAAKAALDEAAEQYRAAYEANLAAIFRHSAQLRRLLRLPRLLRAPLLYVLSRTPALTQWMVHRTR